MRRDKPRAVRTGPAANRLNQLSGNILGVFNYRDEKANGRACIDEPDSSRAARARRMLSAQPQPFEDGTTVTPTARGIEKRNKAQPTYLSVKSVVHIRFAVSRASKSPSVPRNLS